jgi:tellurite resistance protein
MSTQLKFPLVPAAFFGMVLGLAGLGGAWRLASKVWQLPQAIGEAIILLAAIVWLILVVLFALKWALAREEALKEAAHPVQCCFIGLVGVATMLIAGGLLPYSLLAAEILFAIGAAYTLLFAVWRTGGLWQGDRQDAMTTPVLYLPTVAGSFVTAAVASALGHQDWGQLFFGVGVFAWLATESVLLHRMFTVTLPPPLRPALGIQLAPPAVGALAYLGVTQGPPDIFVHMLLGYAILQALILLRLLPWILKEPFSPAYWAFTFGATALSAAPLRLIERGETGPIATLAPILFLTANLVVGMVALATIWLIVKGRMSLAWADLSHRGTETVKQP